MKKRSLIFMISLQIAIMPTLYIILRIVSPDLYHKYDYKAINDVVFFGGIIAVVISSVLLIFCSAKIKNWRFRIAYIILNIFLFVFISSRLIFMFVG